MGTTTQPRKTKISGTVAAAVIVIAVLLLMVLGLIELIGSRPPAQAGARYAGN